MEKQTTSQRLRQIMEERNLKQTDILRMAQPFCEQYNMKLGKSDLSQFVNGKVEPGQWKLTLLGLALNVSEAWLMGFDVPKERAPQLTKAERRAIGWKDVVYRESSTGIVDIKEELETLLSKLDSADNVLFSQKELDSSAKALIESSLKNVLTNVELIIK